MRYFYSLLTLALATTDIALSVSYSLSTGWDGLWNADGCMFEITAKDTPVLIEAFHVHMSPKTDNVAVYYRPGHVDYRYDESYQLIYEAPNVVGAGKGRATPLPPFNPPVVVNPGTPITFYVTVTNNTWEGANLWYTNGEGSGTVMAFDNNINVIEGMTSAYPWKWHVMDRRWNGYVHYSLQAQPTSFPTESPTISLSTSSPTNPPTPKPTRQPSTKTPYPTNSIPSPPTTNLTASPVATQTGSPSGIVDDAGVVDAPTPTISIEPTTTESASTSTKTKMPSEAQAPNDPTDERSPSPTGEGTFPPTKTVKSLLPDFVPSSASMMFNNYMGRICSYLFPLFIIAIFFH